MDARLGKQQPDSAHAAVLAVRDALVERLIGRADLVDRFDPPFS